MTTSSFRRTVLALAMLLAIPAAAQQDDSSDDLPHVLGALNAALERRRSGTATRWNNPATGSYGVVVPAPAFKSTAGQICRSFERTRLSTGRTATYQGVACRGAGGRWTIREETAARSEEATAALRATDRNTAAGSEAPESTGHIAEAQRLLAELGLKPGPNDGILGLRTKSAIQEFQRREGMAIDGRLSEELLARLSAATERADLRYEAPHGVRQKSVAAAAAEVLSPPLMDQSIDVAQRVWAASGVTGARACQCRDRGDVDKRVREAQVAAVAFQEQLEFVRERERRTGKAEPFSAEGKEAVQDWVRAALTELLNRPGSPQSPIFFAEDDTPAHTGADCRIDVTPDATACMQQALLVHEGVHARECKRLESWKDYFTLTLDWKEKKGLAGWIEEEIESYEAEITFLEEQLKRLSCEDYKLQITGTLTYGHSGLGGRVSERMKFQIDGGMSEQSQERPIQGTFTYRMSGVYSYASAYNPCRWSQTYSGDGTIRGEIKQGADGMKGFSLTLQHESGSLLRHEDYGWCAGWLPLELSEKLLEGIQFEAAVPSSGAFPYAQNVMGNVDHTHVTKYGNIEVTYALEPAPAVPAAAWK